MRTDNLSHTVERAKQGDRAAMAELYEATYPEVWRTVCSLIRDDGDAQDVLQETYIKFYGSLDRFRDECDPRPWLRQIAANTARDHLRKKKPTLFTELSETEDLPFEAEDDRTEALPEARLDQRETTRLVREMLDGLSDVQRLVIGMYYYQDAPIKVIAEELNLSENTVKGHLRYGKKKIEKRVRELEKQGVKLYGLTPLLFFRALFKEGAVPAPKTVSDLGGKIAKQGVRALRRSPKAVLAGRIAVAAAAVLLVGGAAAGTAALLHNTPRMGDVRPTEDVVLVPPQPAQTEPVTPPTDETDLPSGREQVTFYYPEITLLDEAAAQPEPVRDFAVSYVKSRISCLTEQLEREITEAEITGLTQLNTGTASLTENICVYRLEYRLKAEGLDLQGAPDNREIEDGRITEWEPDGQPCLFLRESELIDDTGWARLCVSYTDWIEAEFGTDTYLERYENPYTAAAMEYAARYREGKALTPAAVATQIRQNEQYANMTLYLEGGERWKTYPIGNPRNNYYMSAISVLAEALDWTPVERSQPDPAPVKLDVQGSDGTELCAWFSDAGGLVQTFEESDSVLWYGSAPMRDPMQLRAQYGAGPYPEEECGGTFAQQVRRCAYDQIEAQISQISFTVDGGAEAAAKWFVESAFPQHIAGLAPGNEYRFSDYELIDWGVDAVSESGRTVSGHFAFAYLPEVPNAGWHWAGGGDHGPGSWNGKDAMGRSFAIQLQEDGYWYLLEMGTGYCGPPEYYESETDPAEPHLPVEMTMEELEAKLGFGYRLPAEGTYAGTIVCKYDDSINGILLEYSFDGNTVYVVKYINKLETDSYESYAGPDAERGSAVVNGVTVRFRGDPTLSDGIPGLAFWSQNGFEYEMNCETSAAGVDIMQILPLFVEGE